MNGGGLRVVSLNVWGLPDVLNRAPSAIVSQGFERIERNGRMKRMRERFGDFDVICLQEVWLRSDRKSFIKAGQDAGLPYWHYFHSGRRFMVVSGLLGLNEFFNHRNDKQSSGLGIGSGMIILSRYPIIDHQFRLFQLCGKPQRFQHGDYQGAKGIGMVRILIENKVKVDIYTTHTVAGYAVPDEYEAHRVTNFMDYIDFVKEREPSDLVIITGDLNNVPSSPEVKFFMETLQLSDTYEDKHGNINVTTHYFDDCRLDYVLYVHTASWKLTDSFLCFTKASLDQERCGEGDDMFYSDHKGVVAEFQYEEANVSCVLALESALTENTTNQCLALLQDNKERSERRRIIYFIKSLVSFCLGILLVGVPLSGPILESLQVLTVIFVILYSIYCFWYTMFFKRNEVAVLWAAIKAITAGEFKG